MPASRPVSLSNFAPHPFGASLLVERSVWNHTAMGRILRPIGDCGGVGIGVVPDHIRDSEMERLTGRHIRPFKIAETMA